MIWGHTILVYGWKLEIQLLVLLRYDHMVKWAKFVLYSPKILGKTPLAGLVIHTICKQFGFDVKYSKGPCQNRHL